MTHAPSLRALSLPVLTFACILALGLWALTGPLPTLHPTFAQAVLVDMMFTGPLLCLALLAWQRMPPVAAVPFVVIGLNAALFLAPPDLRPLVETLRWGSVALVLLLLAVTAVTLRRKVRAAAPQVAHLSDPRDRFERLATLVLGSDRRAQILAADWAFLRYSVSPPPARPAAGAVTLTSHRTSGFVPLLWAFVGLIVLETVILHVLVHLLAPLLAWVLTLLSLYSLLSLLGHIRALPRRATTIDGDSVTLRVGLFGQAEVPMAAIAAVTRIDANTPLPEGAQRLGVLGAIEPANLMLRLDRPVAVRITHGLGRKARDLVLHLDEPQVLIDAIARARQQADTST